MDDGVIPSRRGGGPTVGRCGVSLRLANLLPQLTFRPFAVDPCVWEGPAFIPSYFRLGPVPGHPEIQPTIRQLQFAYLDRNPQPTRGAIVSNVEAEALADPPSEMTPIDVHLADALFRFDEREAQVRWVRGRPRFVVEEFTATETTLAWGNAGTLYRHRALPLEFIRCTVDHVDVGLGAWGMPAEEFAVGLRAVDMTFALHFDRNARSSGSRPVLVRDDR